jgi:hypothetical protein
MSRSITYTWPASNETDVCKQQLLAVAGNLVLNGNLANQTNSAVNFIGYGYARSITITSTVNLSGSTFTIIGTQNGENIREERAGPTANNTVESANVFDIITSISVNSAAANVKVGSGYRGYFKLIGINLERDIINYSLSIHKLTNISKATEISGILSDIVNNGVQFDNLNTSSLFPIKALSVADQYIFPLQNNGILNPLFKFILIDITGDSTTAANSIQLNFIQT